ncbi:hypothetical protein HPB51_021049 [Rhipicephalus microplus]|uniref:Uncharacterized protein n=1 Tax=Rhipicephalus microplus TaxID=6941 RepID=A0A9J6EC15_RHIMP|nr:hypothetical protein HPB51_021049 [Rhipicephalus microplus]
MERYMVQEAAAWYNTFKQEQGLRTNPGRNMDVLEHPGPLLITCDMGKNWQQLRQNLDIIFHGPALLADPGQPPWNNDSPNTWSTSAPPDHQNISPITALTPHWLPSPVTSPLPAIKPVDIVYCIRGHGGIVSSMSDCAWLIVQPLQNSMWNRAANFDESAPVLREDLPLVQLQGKKMLRLQGSHPSELAEHFYLGRRVFPLHTVNWTELRPLHKCS